MDPIATLAAQRALVIETNTIEDRWPDDGDPPISNVGRWQEIALEFSELVGALDQWRLKGGFDPYTSAAAGEELATTRVLVDVAFGIGGLSETYCLATATRDGQPVVVFCERTADGLFPLAEVQPPREGYTPLQEARD